MVLTALSQDVTPRMSAVGLKETAETESVGGETISVSWDAFEPRTIAIVKARKRGVVEESKEEEKGPSWLVEV